MQGYSVVYRCEVKFEDLTVPAGQAERFAVMILDAYHPESATTKLRSLIGAENRGFEIKVLETMPYSHHMVSQNPFLIY